jgi:hypothetical protein
MHLAEVKRIVVKKLMYYDEFGSGVPDTYEYVPLCKDCKYGYQATDCALYFCTKPYQARGNAAHQADWFCADGRRKDDKSILR